MTALKASFTVIVGLPKCSTCCITGSGRRLAKVSPARSSTGRRFAWAGPAAVTMLSAPGPIEEVGDHDLPAPLGLGEADRGQRHRLLVLAAPGRQAVLDGFERLGEAGDVAVAEDREHAGEERHALAVDLGELLRQLAHQRLRHGQADRCLDHRSPPSTDCGHHNNHYARNDLGTNSGRNADEQNRGVH